MPIDLSGFSAGWTFLGGSGLTTLTSPLSPISPLPSANVAAFFRGTDCSAEQAFTTTAPAPTIYTIGFYVGAFWWPTGAETLTVLIDGVVAYTSGAINPNIWSHRTFNRTLSAGTHSIKFVATNPALNVSETAFLDSVTITDPSGNPVSFVNGNANFDSYTLSNGQIVFNPPAIATPTIRSVIRVTTCGTRLELELTQISDGSLVLPRVINEAPIVSINGNPVGALRIASPWQLTTSAHTTILLSMPSGVSATSGDTVTLSASEGWIFGPIGYAEGLANQTAVNRVGRSFVRLVDVQATMWLGVGYSHLQTPEWHSGFLPMNQCKRCGPNSPPIISETTNHYPSMLNGTNTSCPIVKLSGVSFLDNTGCPTPPGYWAVRYDDQDGHSSASLTNGDAGNTSCTEITSIGNPGVGGAGIVRVFDFQPTGITNTVPPYFEHLADLQVWLRFTSTNPQDPITHGYPLNIANVAVLAPGDFTWTAGQPTVIPMPLWSDVAGAVEAKIPPSLPFGPHRAACFGIKIGESPACEREQVAKPDDFRWNLDVQTAINIGYVLARPWTNAASPFIYNPLEGTDYPATLSAPITTAPPSGTIENITISDAASAPVFACLVLTIGSERLRVMSVSGTTVTVMRGVESTTPSTHSAGTISVSARRPMANLAAFGPGGRQVTELVTQFPHGLKSGQGLQMDGSGWPPFTWTDGSGFRGGTFSQYNFIPFVTGANSFVTVGDNPNPTPGPNVTLSTSYTLDPGPASPTHLYVCTSLVWLPEFGGIPYEYAATLAAKHPIVPALVSFCMVASDDMVDSIIRDRILPYLPADRDLYFEVGDEPWNNFGIAYSYWSPLSYFRYGTIDPLYSYGVRVGRIRDRIRAIWQAAGRDPLKVKSTLNFQTAPGNSGSLGVLLNFLATQSAVPDLVEIAPYYDPYPDHAIWQAHAAWTTAELVDAYVWDFYRNNSPGSGNWGGGQLHRIGDYKVAIDAWNAAHSGNVKLGIYEYAPDRPWPVYLTSSSTTGGLGADMDDTTQNLVLPNANVYNPLNNNWDDCQKICPGTWLQVGDEWMTVNNRVGVNCNVNRAQGGTTAAPHAAGTYLQNDWIPGVRDITLHPNYGIAHFDFLHLFQALGVELFTPSALNQEWSGGGAIADYHAIDQLPGRGDGSDGKFNNLLCLARPGQPHTKSPTVNQDANTVSPRGAAGIRFVTNDFSNPGDVPDGGNGDNGGNPPLPPFVGPTGVSPLAIRRLLSRGPGTFTK